jgi:hypothetical protein
MASEPCASVANNTRADGREFLAEAATIPVHTHVETFPFEQANEALLALKNDAIAARQCSWLTEWLRAFARAIRNFAQGRNFERSSAVISWQNPKPNSGHIHCSSLCDVRTREPFLNPYYLQGQDFHAPSAKDFHAIQQVWLQQNFE